MMDSIDVALYAKLTGPGTVTPSISYDLLFVG